MKRYRCYLYDPRAHTIAIEKAGHDNDDAAVAWARQLHRVYSQFPAIDLWHGDRLVWRSEGSPDQH